MLKRIAVFVLATLLTVCTISSTAYAAGTKNETVYAMLNYDGSVEISFWGNIPITESIPI
jgi:hypothetical protein